MIARRLSLMALALAFAQPAEAALADGHVLTPFYQPDTVVPIVGAVGWQVMIEFAADERIENVSIGDSTAWQVAPNKRARMLFLKPLSTKASTNMVVITSQRTYTFALSVAPRRATTPWTVRFEYPAPPPPEPIPEPPPPPPVSLDFGYGRAGDAGLLPLRVWDDGRQTYFEFADEVPLPAIFAGSGKDESLVNVSMRGRIAVVQQRATRFTLRSGKRVATITKQP